MLHIQKRIKKLDEQPVPVDRPSLHLLPGGTSDGTSDDQELSVYHHVRLSQFVALNIGTSCKSFVDSHLGPTSLKYTWHKYAQITDQDKVPTLATTSMLSMSTSEDGTYTELQCHQVCKPHEADCVEYPASASLAPCCRPLHEDDAACFSFIQWNNTNKWILLKAVLVNVHLYRCILRWIDGTKKE